ncbi:hypothetical protein M9Y10_041613 [Tritrichomonas musculus]|uniref:Uncharacterized protein n=1 Tax=Tritrichomonas musculus TaxID=1915356 RepID=A0ABR2K5L1_9EUKA
MLLLRIIFSRTALCMNQPRMQQWVLDILLRRILDQQYDLTPSSDQTTPNSQKNYQPNLLSNQHNYKPQ